MKKLLLSTILAGLALPVAAAEVNVVSWGGSYTASQVEAYNKPFTEKTGIKVNMIDADDPQTPLKAQVEAGNVTADVFDISAGPAMRLCDEGALVEIDPASLPAAPDGTPAAEDFFPGAIQECAVANIFWGTPYAFDTTKFADKPPATAKDFFDTAAFPGKRGLPKDPKRALTFALVADGVAPAEVLATLGTPEGVDRAFKKLDAIKGDVVWWDAGAQPIQLLADGEVAMTQVYNGRIFDAIVGEKKPFGVVWDGQYLDMDMFVIPKGAPNAEAALEYVKFATDTQRLADQAKYISYGPSRKSSAGLVGVYKDGTTQMAPHMPTDPANMATAVTDDPEFWADHEAELTERFNSWLAG